MTFIFEGLPRSRRSDQVSVEEDRAWFAEVQVAGDSDAMHVCLQVDHSRVQVVRPSEPSREVHTQRKQPSLSLSLFINFKFQSESLLIYCKKLKMIM